ncbi:MAG: hypothetical protein IKJ45_13110 [Kiritimatiellae bacterium]|nr:hypothetical protein [Kiritimatiellia bacterium]
MFKWAVSSEGRRGEYSAYYRIGAEWVDDERALVVAPKVGMEEIDWPVMLMRCFDTEEGCADGLGNIYNIDFAVPPIRDATLQNILTPLLVVHFVGIVRRIVKQGLKHDYVQQEGDLSRVSGRIGFLQNFRRNIIVGWADRVFCRYSELSVNTCENRLIKRALLFAERIVGRMLDQGQRSAVMLQEQLALYYGIGRFISVNTRKRNWGAGIIDGISERLKAELPGLRGFSGRSLKNMRSFYEAWSMLEPNSAIQIAELPKGTNYRKGSNYRKDKHGAFGL